MRFPFFGISPEHFDKGIEPACAINDAGLVVEIHKAEGLVGWLFWRLGQVHGTSLRWTAHEKKKYDDGYNPSVAVTNENVVLEVHDTGGASPNCWSRVGRVTNNKIEWRSGKKYDGGRDPTVAVNRHGVVVEVHKREIGSKLFWSVGRLEGTTLTWTGHNNKKFAEGEYPSIAINDGGYVVLVYTYDLELYCSLGRVVDRRIDWLSNEKYTKGWNASVTLTNDNYVYEVHQKDGNIYQRSGRIQGNGIVWFDMFGNGEMDCYFDDGTWPQIASNGRHAVHTHISENIWFFHGNTSLIFDRASWMEDHLNVLGSRSLSQIVIPASHDAGMYLGGFSFATLGKTQDLNVLGQLMGGVRYFDLRPQAKKNEVFVLHHGEGFFNVEGANLTDVLTQIATFMQNHRELVVLKISHYEDFSQTAFTNMCNQITTAIGTWLCPRPPAGTRLANVPINHFIGRQGAVLVVCGGSYTVPAGTEGIYVYRDWDSGSPEEGDLTVFDQYSDTTDFDTMAYSTAADKEVSGLQRGQLQKFKNFDGKCLKKPEVPCDLFLLSWTLTPTTAVWPYSRLANKALVDNLTGLGANAAGRIVNVLYVDYSEYSRAADVALERNGLI